MVLANPTSVVQAPFQFTATPLQTPSVVQAHLNRRRHPCTAPARTAPTRTGTNSYSTNSYRHQLVQAPTCTPLYRHQILHPCIGTNAYRHQLVQAPTCTPLYRHQIVHPCTGTIAYRHQCVQHQLVHQLAKAPTNSTMTHLQANLTRFHPQAACVWQRSSCSVTPLTVAQRTGVTKFGVGYNHPFIYAYMRYFHQQNFHTHTRSRTVYVHTCNCGILYFVSRKNLHAYGLAQ